MYTEIQVNELEEKRQHYFLKCLELESRILECSTRMSSTAKSHAIYGVARRLQTLRNCIEFFFDAIPPNVTAEPDINTRAQCDAHLHAYLINCCGIFDNMAWSLAFHMKLDEQMDLEKEKFTIDLFKDKFKPHLSTGLASRVIEFEEWHSFLLDQRHPTAHRIPPYVIPAIQYEDTGRVDFTPYYVHSLDNPKMVPLHLQTICDMGAVLLIAESWLDSL
jgi:hypothetical protein